MWTAWAIAKELNLLLPAPIIQLKWRNDLMVKGQKLGGILVETRSSQGVIKYAVVGVGVNYSNSVPEGVIALNQIANHQISLLEKLCQLVHQAILNGYIYWSAQGMTEILASYPELMPS